MKSCSALSFHNKPIIQHRTFNCWKWVKCKKFACILVRFWEFYRVLGAYILIYVFVNEKSCRGICSGIRCLEHTIWVTHNSTAIFTQLATCRQAHMIKDHIFITGKYKPDHLEDDLRQLHRLNIRKRITFKSGLLAYKAINGITPLNK